MIRRARLWSAFDPWIGRVMHRLGRHDPWCRGLVGRSCDPALRPDLWVRRPSLRRRVFLRWGL